MTIAVIIASTGRSQALAELLQDLARQTRLADRIILALTRPGDRPANAADFPNVEVIYAPKGSCSQRNAALDHLAGATDIILFLDDDYVPSRFAIERAEQLICRHPDIAGATGHLLADGCHGPGISIQDARRSIADYDCGESPAIEPYRDLRGLYGCNMVFRTAAVGELRFDERLPLYGWQEDIDFSVRARAAGRTVKTFAFAGVHRGIKAGRSSGVRVGYSQVVNPIYLVRKGTMDAKYARKIIVRNVLSNHVRAFRPEAWVDRAGRLRGNWLGMMDVLRGRAYPERILKF